jgi:hypothetical protein
MKNVIIQKQSILALRNDQNGQSPVHTHQWLCMDINREFEYALHTNRMSPNAVKNTMRLLKEGLGMALLDEMKFWETVNAVIREFYEI